MTAVEAQETSIGAFPALVAGEGRPVVVLAGLSPDVGVDAPSMRRVHQATMEAFLATGRVHYVNRRRGLAAGTTMAGLAAEHAEALRETFDAPVDLVGLSTGGSIAQQIAADHPDVVRRLILVATACRLGPRARLEQWRTATAIRASRPRGVPRLIDVRACHHRGPGRRTPGTWCRAFGAAERRAAPTGWG